MHLPNANASAAEAFPISSEGFLKFVNALGPRPKKMKNPSLGRIDHTKPYTPENIQWQDWECNKAEAHFRKYWLYPLGIQTWQQLVTNLKKRT